MYIVKVAFPRDEAFPVATVIDHGTHFYSLAAEVMQFEQVNGYGVTRESFSCGVARSLAQELILGARGLRYQYTDGFLPDATFVFEYD